jgi:hypothetical protein
MGFPDFDSDEMYFGHMVNNSNHGINVIKLKRGFYSKFKCPGRIDRIDDSSFNVYEDRLLNNGNYIDCHLSRPASKYSREMNLLKKKILKNKEIYLIGCHIENNKQLSLLAELVDKLISEGKNYVITSHTMIPESIIRSSVGFVYDSVNPKYKTWELECPNKYTIDNGTFSITSPYITYGRKDYYHVGVLRLLLNGLNYLKNLDYDVVHWIEYDAIPDFREDSINLSRLNTYDFVFYGIGSKFSFLNKKVNKLFLDSRNKDLLNLLSLNDYVAERVITNNLIAGEKLVIGVEGKNEFYGRYSHNSEVDFDWSFYEHNGIVNIFINNSGSRKIRFEITYDQNNIVLESHPMTWILNPVAAREKLNAVSFKADEDLIVELDLTDEDVYQRVVKSVTINFY